MISICWIHSRLSRLNNLLSLLTCCCGDLPIHVVGFPKAKCNDWSQHCGVGLTLILRQFKRLLPLAPSICGALAAAPACGWRVVFDSLRASHARRVSRMFYSRWFCQHGSFGQGWPQGHGAAAWP